MALDFPTSPVVGDKYPTSPAAGQPQYQWDGEKWVAVTTAYLPTTGGVITGTLGVNGVLTEGTGVGTAQITINGGAGSNKVIVGQSNGKSRWNLQLGNPNPETGGNAGSDFLIARFNDAGTVIDQPLTIMRATGSASFIGSVLAAGQTAPSPITSGSLYSGSGYYIAGAKVTAFMANMNFDGANYRAIQAGGGGLLQYNGSGAALWNFYSNPSLAANAAFTPTLVLTVDQTGCLTFNQIQMAGHKFNWNWAANGALGQLQLGVDGSSMASVKSTAVNPYNSLIDTMALGSGVAALWSGGAGCTWTVATSDRRLKSKITDAAKDALAALRSLKVFEFDLTPPGSETAQHWNWGVMADDALETAIPSSVHPAAETDGGTIYASLNEFVLIGALIKAVQQLSARVEELEARAA